MMNKFDRVSQAYVTLAMVAGKISTASKNLYDKGVDIKNVQEVDEIYEEIRHFLKKIEIDLPEINHEGTDAE